MDSACCAHCHGNINLMKEMDLDFNVFQAINQAKNTAILSTN